MVAGTMPALAGYSLAITSLAVIPLADNAGICAR